MYTKQKENPLTLITNKKALRQSKPKEGIIISLFIDNTNQFRLNEYGPNAVEEKVKPLWRLFLEKFIGPMEILIEIAVILSLLNAIFSPQHVNYFY